MASPTSLSNTTAVKTRMASPTSASNIKCYVFLDDSNLWIAGQKVRGKKLKDTDTDPRYRVDLGKFLDLVTENRQLFSMDLSLHLTMQFGRQHEKTITR